MNTLLNNVLEDYDHVLVRYTFACRNYYYHSATGDYVRHRTLSKDVVRPYLVTSKDMILPRSFLGVWGFSFSSNGVIL